MKRRPPGLHRIPLGPPRLGVGRALRGLGAPLSACISGELHVWSIASALES